MIMKPQELRDLIQETLAPAGVWSDSAAELLMATAAQESHLGEYRRQINGPALGLYQMEPATFSDIWTNYLAYHPGLAAELSRLATTQPPRPVEMVTNDAFATLMARVHYLRAPGALPAATDLAGLWNYYRVHYNTVLGKATQDEFYANYKKYVGGAAA